MPLPDPKKLAGTNQGVLANEIAGRSSDPNFYAALQVLPNPDTILRQMGRGQEIYDAIAYDAHVMGELRSIRAGTLAWEWRLQPGGEEPRDLQAYELCEKVFARRPAPGLTWQDHIWNSTKALFHGYAVHEIIWQRDGNFFVPERLLDRPQRRFNFDTDNKLRLITKENLDPGEELGDYKWLLTRHMASHDNPYGVAVFSACFWPYTFKHNGYRWFAKFVERYGIPSPVGKYPIGSSDENIQELVDRLAQMLEDAVAAIPADGSVELLEAQAGSQNFHGSFIDLCNREISKAITSQTLGTEVQDSGSRAVAEVQRKREEGGQEADREMVVATIQQMCSWITELNYPGAKPPIWEFFDEFTLAKETAETLEIASRVVPLIRDEVYERLQMTPPQEGDEVIFRGGQKQLGPDDPNQPGDPSKAGEKEEEGTGSDDQEGTDTEEEFANPGDTTHDPVDLLATQADNGAQALIDSMTAEVKAALDHSANLQEFSDALVKLYPTIDDTQLGEHLALASLVTYLKGADDAADA